MQPRPFQIHVEDQVLQDLRLRLERTRWPALAADPDWELGTDETYLRQIAQYWHQGYDWRAQELMLNGLPQFKVKLSGADLHFVHRKSSDRQATPLLLLHGWPDSFYRFHRVIPLLAEPSGTHEAGGFSLVAPSLPGFAFTGRVERASQAQPLRQTAQLLWELMTQVLGYERFAIAGGDTGGAIAQIIAIDHPESVFGIHLTDLGWYATNVDPAGLSKPEQKYLEASKKGFLKDGAYVAVQTTRPRDLAPGLNDSPVGLASWILDRFHSWSDCGDDLERSFSKDDLLTNIMLYWLTQTAGSSVFRYYAEARSPSLQASDRVTVPVALALFPKEPNGVPPRSLAERTLNVQRWTEMPRGGHFAALEVPELYAEDLRESFRGLRKAH